MGGPWKAKGYDPRAWKPPAPRVAAKPEGSDDRVRMVVLGYVAAVALSFAVVLTLLKLGW